MRAILLAVAVLGLGGCASKPFVNSHSARKIVLTSSSPPDRVWGVQLIRVEPDGTAVIAASRSGETLAAKPGQPFLGKRLQHGARVFGDEGLTLLRSDYAAQRAVFLVRWAGPFP